MVSDASVASSTAGRMSPLSGPPRSRGRGRHRSRGIWSPRCLDVIVVVVEVVERVVEAVVAVPVVVAALASVVGPAG